MSVTRPVAAALLWLCAALPLAAATEVVEVTSEGGITAWLVEEHSIPMMAMNITFEGGPALDPDDKLGATNLMMNLIEEGAGSLDSVAFAARTQELAARFRFGADRASASVTAQMLTEERDASVTLLALAINDPIFDPDAIERVRAQVLSSIRAAETDPNEIAAREFSERAYRGHVGARRYEGSIDTVGALTRDDLLDAHRRVFTRDKLRIGVVGDITAAELGPVLDLLFGGLPESGPPVPAPAEIQDSDETVIVPFDTPQSVARFGHSSIERDDPDFIAAFVVNEILGGARSRLNREVREKRGLTYGIFTVLANDSLGSIHLGSVSSANDRIAEAVQIVRAEWARMAREGATAEELDAAKRYLTGAYALRFTSNAGIAAILTNMQMAGLPASYIAERNDMIEALTLDEVNSVAARVLKPEALRVVVVGKPVGLAETE